MSGLRHPIPPRARRQAGTAKPGSGAVLRRALVLVVSLLIVAAACGADDQPDGVAAGADGATTESVRSSGRLAYSDGDDVGDGTDQTGDDPAGPATGASADGSDGSGGSEGADGADGAGAAAGPDDGDVFVPPDRLDGIELVFADGALGPAQLGATIDDITTALGPSFEVTPEAAIRVDFPAGYSVSKDGEVMFWVIEEDGVATVFMTVNPKVGLDSGLRPRLALADAIALHGEPTLTLGEHAREFASFADGTGAGLPVSILVAIGQFGGPVGSYDSGFGPGSSTEAYQLEEANIKELWFLTE